jgi:hypothetical protein
MQLAFGYGARGISREALGIFPSFSTRRKDFYGTSQCVGVALATMLCVSLPTPMALILELLINE